MKAGKDNYNFRSLDYWRADFARLLFCTVVVLTGLDSLLYVELPDPDGFRRRMIVLCSIAI